MSSTLYRAACSLSTSVHRCDIRFEPSYTCFGLNARILRAPARRPGFRAHGMFGFVEALLLLYTIRGIQTDPRSKNRQHRQRNPLSHLHHRKPTSEQPEQANLLQHGLQECEEVAERANFPTGFAPFWLFRLPAQEPAAETVVDSGAPATEEAPSPLGIGICDGRLLRTSFSYSNPFNWPIQPTQPPTAETLSFVLGSQGHRRKPKHSSLPRHLVFLVLEAELLAPRDSRAPPLPESFPAHYVRTSSLITSGWLGRRRSYGRDDTEPEPQTPKITMSCCLNFVVKNARPVHDKSQLPCFFGMVASFSVYFYTK